MEEEQKQEEIVEEKESEIIEEQKEDRPERNYQSELARKNQEIERLRQEAESMRVNTVQKRDPADLSTWTDNELVSIKNSNDPNVMAWKGQAEDVLLERKVNRIREKERMQEKRASADSQLRTKYPEVFDSTSPFAAEVEKVMYDFDLQKSPAGRLAAAELVAARMQKGSAQTEAKGRSAEAQRVRDVKAQMVDGDRPKSTGTDVPQKEKDLKERILKGDTDAVGETLKQRGVTHDSFFGQNNRR